MITLTISGILAEATAHQIDQKTIDLWYPKQDEILPYLDLISLPDEETAYWFGAVVKMDNEVSVERDGELIDRFNIGDLNDDLGEVHHHPDLMKNHSYLFQRETIKGSCVWTFDQSEYDRSDLLFVASSIGTYYEEKAVIAEIYLKDEERYCEMIGGRGVFRDCWID